MRPEPCRDCKKPATVHLTQVHEGQVQKFDFCEDCPHQKEALEASQLPFLKVLEEIRIGQKDVTCTTCGFGLKDLKRKGRLGCPNCYTSFRELVLKLCGSFSSEIEHVGRVPVRTAGFSELKEALASAVAKEDFEQAVQLRDKLKALEPQGKGG